MTKIISRLSLFAALAAAFLPVRAVAESLLIARLGPNTVAANVAKKYGLTLKDTTSGAPFALYSAVSATVAEKAQTAMRVDAGIVWVEDNASMASPESQAKNRALVEKGGIFPAVGGRQKLQEINKNLLAQVGWSPTLANAAGRVVRVALLDTGLSQKQIGLWSKVDASANFIEIGKPAYDQPMKLDTNKNGSVDDALGHGTMIASIVDQIAPQVRFVVARVADSDGMASGWTLVKGLAFAVTSKAEVANVSLASASQIAALNDVMDWCEQNRLLVVAAIGNDGARRACYPARISKVVCVSGLLPDSTKAPFSNWDGSCDVAAPATGFVSQYWDGQLAVWSGTSFAAPVAVAAVADCLRRGTAVPPASLRKAFESSGTKIDNLNPKYKGELGVLVNIVRLDQVLRKP